MNIEFRSNYYKPEETPEPTFPFGWLSLQFFGKDFRVSADYSLSRFDMQMDEGAMEAYRTRLVELETSLSRAAEEVHHLISLLPAMEPAKDVEAA